MAKITLTKLNLKKDTTINTFDWHDQVIEVKEYLPMEEKLELISTIINRSVDDNGYYNVAAVYVNMIVEIIFAYTNITATDKQKENYMKLYDLFVSSGLSGEIIGNHMNPSEYNQIKTWTVELIHNIYEYKNSVSGILDTIGYDYSNMNLDASVIQKNLADPENLELLRDVLTKLG